MAGDAEPKRGYRTIFRSISQVFYANAKNTSSNNINYNNTNNSNNTNNNERLQMDNNNSLTATLTNVTKSPSISPSTSTSTTSTTPSITLTTENIAGKCIECQDQSAARLRASSMLDLSSNSRQSTMRNCVIKVRRPAPKVPVRNPNTTLSNPQKESNNNSSQVGVGEGKRLSEGSYGEEESIYQPIWQFKTLEPPVEDPKNVEETAVGAPAAAVAPELAEVDDEEDEDDDDDDDDEDGEEEEEEELEVEDDFDDDADADADADVMAIQAAAVFAAGVRYKLSTSTLTKRSKMMLPTPLPSPTASMDQGAWETDAEFMFSRDTKEAVADTLETLSLGSTVTNSTATMGSLSSTGSATRLRPSSSQKVSLVHPVLRNICIFHSIREPKKYSAIFYDYQRSQVHQRFMTRIRRPAPPPPAPPMSAARAAPKMQQPAPQMMPLPLPVPLPTINDDSGCSCDATEDGEVVHSQSKFVAIPTPLKEDWALACLAAAAVTKRGAGPRSARKLRVRSNVRLLLTDSVLAWRASLQDINCCEDEEDMVSICSRERERELERARARAWSMSMGTTL
ncbi:GL14654 [Drosophila persimilis]|uniref:GL14654 n=1 Tax=Drosophila persimilis TaxID=7234 RepID=B4GVL0_DROPE|nr:GL14654 [Drosophila persimilis]